MGGNTLKLVKTCRLDKEKYEEITKFILDKIDKYYNVFVPFYTKDKTDFGDLDVIINNKEIIKEEIDIRKLIKEMFNPREIVRNGNMISFDFNINILNYEVINECDSFQIDFIIVNKEDFNSTCFYFSFNDFGRILGMMFRQYGFGFGEKGLFYDIYDENDISYKIGRVYITKNIKEICDIAKIKMFDFNKKDYCYDITWTEIFDILSSSVLFSPEYWTSESDKWNSDTKRALNRPMFSQFIFEYIPTKYNFKPYVLYSDVKKKFITDPVKQKFITDPVKQKFINEILTQYNLLEKVNEIYKNHHLEKKAKEMFNGNIVIEITGLKGKELGIFIENLKKDNPTTINSIIWLNSDDRNPDEIKKIINDYYSSYKNDKN
jgi:hypothetical protein